MIEKNELIKAAYSAMNKSYSPFSKVKVGACIATDKRYYTGSNRDIDGFKTKECAERIAIEKAYECNDKDIKNIVIISNEDDFSYPSGSTRQMIYEFAPNAEILLINSNFEEKKCTIEDLLPFPSKRL